MTLSRHYDRLIRVKILSTLILILGLASTSFAATTLSSVIGASTTKISTTDNSWSVYGGIQGPSFSGFCASGSGPCNTCTGANMASDGACNPTGVFANTPITFQGTTSVTTAGAKWLLCNAATEVFPTNSTGPQDMLTTTWGEICSSTTGGSDSNCSGDMSTTTVYLGVGADCSNLGTEKVAIKFLSREIDIDTSSVYVDCPPPAANSGNGACHFTLFPGDSKVYLEESTFNYNNEFPAVFGGPSLITTDNIYFFFVQSNPAETDVSAFGRITNDAASSMSTSFIPVTADSASVTLGGSIIDDLNNDARYCFRMASQDTAGNIEYFTPSAGVCPDADGTPECENVCMTPSEVVGVLSDKKCFIATAAFGSEMDQHVQMLRDFRNKFMAPYWLGRKLVKAYYAVSPTLAKWISQNEEAKILTRWVLWPILGWAELTLKFGWSVLLAPFFGLIFCFYFARRIQLKRRFEKA